MRDGEALEKVLSLKIPTVVVGHRRKEVSGVVNVVTDSPLIGLMGAEHLIERGFKHFAFVGMSAGLVDVTSWSNVREENFARRVREMGLEASSYVIEQQPGRDWTRERAALAAWLKSLPKPVGLMACNDDCGVQVMEACKSVGLTVPDLVGVIGVDNDEIVCGLSNPAMSSVAINFERAGFDAAHALDQMMQGKALPTARINASATHIVTRRSTDVVAVSDLMLARALRYIRDHSREAIKVDDVARAAALSRRALERRFRAELGVSILEQIRKERAGNICRLLVETALPVGRIAEMLGFDDVQHFARYFRVAKNMSPLNYRKSFGGRSHSLALSAPAQKGDSFSQTGVGRIGNEGYRSSN